MRVYVIPTRHNTRHVISSQSRSDVSGKCCQSDFGASVMNMTLKRKCCVLINVLTMYEFCPISKILLRDVLLDPIFNTLLALDAR